MVAMARFALLLLLLLLCSGVGGTTVAALGAFRTLGAFLGLPLLTFLPVITKDVFQQDVAFYSWLMTCSGAGAVVGALVVAEASQTGSSPVAPRRA